MFLSIDTQGYGNLSDTSECTVLYCQLIPVPARSSPPLPVSHNGALHFPTSGSINDPLLRIPVGERCTFPESLASRYRSHCGLRLTQSTTIVILAHPSYNIRLDTESDWYGRQSFSNPIPTPTGPFPAARFANAPDLHDASIDLISSRRELGLFLE